jgi:hypothetical protein
MQERNSVLTALFIKILEELGIRFTTPEVKVTNLKVGPDCVS